MPLYDLKCAACQSRVERRVPMADADKQRCECGGRLVVVVAPVRRVWKGRKP